MRFLITFISFSITILPASAQKKLESVNVLEEIENLSINDISILQNKGLVELIWKVDVNTSYAQLNEGILDYEAGIFLVERSTDGHNFAPINAIPASDKASSYNKKFVFRDWNAPKGDVYYRIHKCGRDGTFYYSSIKSVWIEPNLAQAD